MHFLHLPVICQSGVIFIMFIFISHGVRVWVQIIFHSIIINQLFLLLHPLIFFILLFLYLGLIF